MFNFVLFEALIFYSLSYCFPFHARLLTLWFDYGQWPGVNDIMSEGIKSIQIDNWLQVIPQLIARIDTPRLLVQRLVHQLLVDIGKAHPQVIVDRFNLVHIHSHIVLKVISIMRISFFFNFLFLFLKCKMILLKIITEILNT